MFSYSLLTEQRCTAVHSLGYFFILASSSFCFSVSSFFAAGGAGFTGRGAGVAAVPACLPPVVSEVLLAPQPNQLKIDEAAGGSGVPTVLV
jgi:hypothetical protein